MKISALKIRILDTQTKLAGVVSLVFDDMFAVHDIKVLVDGEKRFIAMPSKKVKDDAFRDIVHPINADVRCAIEKIVFSVYDYCIANECSSVNCKLNADFTGSLFEQNPEDFSMETYSKK